MGEKTITDGEVVICISVILHLARGLTRRLQNDPIPGRTNSNTNTIPFSFHNHITLQLVILHSRSIFRIRALIPETLAAEKQKPITSKSLSPRSLVPCWVWFEFGSKAGGDGTYGRLQRAPDRRQIPAPRWRSRRVFSSIPRGRAAGFRGKVKGCIGEMRPWVLTWRVFLRERERVKLVGCVRFFVIWHKCP